MFLSEELIQFIWANQLFNSQELTTDQGQTVQVLHPGNWNGIGAGPDFKGARIRIGKTLFAGAVEIHLRASEWYNHRHQENPAYNAVVLHVSFYDQVLIERKDGTRIPHICLEKYVDERLLHKYTDLLHSSRNLPCDPYLTETPQLLLAQLIDRMQVERLEARMHALEQCFAGCDKNWSQLLFIQLCRSFGLPRNGAPFQELGERTPYELVLRHTHNPIQVEAIFFGQCGLIPAEPRSEYAKRLKSEYGFLSAKYNLRPIHATIDRGAIRPTAAPSLRLAHLANLLGRQDLINSIYEYPAIQSLYNILRKPLPEYWSRHYQLDSKETVRTSKLGQQSIDLVLINGIAPVLFFYGRKRSLPAYEEKSLSLLQHLKPEVNRISRFWKDRQIKAANAAESQGLLHLYKTYCTFKRCLNCQIGKHILSRT